MTKEYSWRSLQEDPNLARDVLFKSLGLVSVIAAAIWSHSALQESQTTQALPPPPRRPPYFELRKDIQKLTEGYEFTERFRTAYSQATVVDQAPWFPKRKLCKETCCVETVAISANRDRAKPIHWHDGREIADLAVNHNDDKGVKRIQVHASDITDEMLPCLVPGTVIFVHNVPAQWQYFWNHVRPRIRVPYVLIMASSDDNSPGFKMGKYLADPLLIRFYGSNGRNSFSHDANLDKNFKEKFEGISVGLSPQHPQESHINPYLYLTNYTNPFLDKSKWSLKRESLDVEKDIFVNFGLERHPMRPKLWEILCPNANSASSNDTTTNPNNTKRISCNEIKNVHVTDIYSEMSQYRFGISPPGHGWDCYRTYELLLMGVIPIVHAVEARGAQELFEGLPVILMDLEKATSQHDFVRAIQKYIASSDFQKDSFEKGWERLFLRHRRRQALEVAGRDKDFLERNGKEYYQAYHYSVVPQVEAGSKSATSLIRKQANWLEEAPELTEDETEWLQAWAEGKKSGQTILAWERQY